ncbi:hypothetical protein CfE428DRAFT_3072 [Chthoniobacter flavus Ellin428]|uniref:Glycosyltransferase 2-like domain-containing protein n=1 Tax=Chthoniobacter flavus Ellin428 TaxID=497964 RepID=B4D2E7_9BACT|nr:glycosyltransferase [Chthoniobacter flavus]EDY19387.1 hypothetical protein CfE428DRAFT_3072 [Chthoniobacter flavus Ellin428]
MADAKIIGITLVRNEDIFVERAVRNVIDFCDRLIIADNYSTDETFEIVSKLAAEFPNKIELHRITDTRESHFLISGFAGSKTWIFAVDGDEVYDPVGLPRLREELLRGDYDDWWIVFGNVLELHGGRFPGRNSDRLPGAAVPQHDQAFQFPFD